MLEYDAARNYGLPMEESLRPLRIKRNPIRFDEGLVCNDQLESKGIIQILEYTGGSLYVQLDADVMGHEANAVMVAEVTVSADLKERVVYVDRIFYEYGHDELIPVLMGQISNFADFYCCRVCIADRRKVEKLRRQWQLAGNV